MTCQPGECIPVDVCAECREPVMVSGAYAWHRARATIHEAQPIVVCATCGTQAEPVGPAELAEAWGDMLAAQPVKGQTSWLG